MQSQTITRVVIAILMFSTQLFADIVMLGGYGSVGDGSDAPQYPIGNTFSTGSTQTTIIPFPPSLQASVQSVIVDPYSGTVLYIGQDGNNRPLLFRGSVVSTVINPIPFSSETLQAALINAAFDSHGNAIIVGQDTEHSLPLIYRLPLGANALTSISIPSSDQAALTGVAIGPNNIAYVAGQNLTTATPLGYSLASDATIAAPILFSGITNGSLYVVQFGPDGSAFFGGHNSSTDPGEALIYRIPAGSSTSSLITVPGTDDGGDIFGLTCTPDGNAIFVGSTFAGGYIPLIYSLAKESSSATFISNPNGNHGQILAAAINSNGTSILVGRDETTSLPLIYSVASGASFATSIDPPSADQGFLFAVAIDSEDLAILGGGYDVLNQLLILSLPAGSTTPSLISSSDSLNSELILSIGTYKPFSGLYNLARQRPFYYSKLYEAQGKINEAGIP